MNGPALKKIRNNLGLSIADAARQAGVSARSWLRWESGKSSPVRPFTIRLNPKNESKYIDKSIEVVIG